MPRPTLLSATAREDGLSALPDWTLSADGKSIQRRCRFADFAAAFAFMSEVAKEAEALDHHPDWRNVYNQVEISLTTHDAGGLTALDLALAQKIDQQLST